MKKAEIGISLPEVKKELKLSALLETETPAKGKKRKTPVLKIEKMNNNVSDYLKEYDTLSFARKTEIGTLLDSLFYSQPFIELKPCKNILDKKLLYQQILADSTNNFVFSEIVIKSILVATHVRQYFENFQPDHSEAGSTLVKGIFENIKKLKTVPNKKIEDALKIVQATHEEQAKICIDKKIFPADILGFMGFPELPIASKIYDNAISQVLLEMLVTKKIDSLTEDTISFILDILTPASQNGHTSSDLVSRLDKLMSFCSQSQTLLYLLLSKIEKICGIPPDWDILPWTSASFRDKYNAHRGKIRFQLFTKVTDILSKVGDFNEENERVLLVNRTLFWSNYDNQIRDLVIFLPENELSAVENAVQSSKKDGESLAASHLREVGTSKLIFPLCLISMENFLAVELLYGNSHRTLFIEDSENQIFKKIRNSKVFDQKKYDLLLGNAQFSVAHAYKWQSQAAINLRDHFNISCTKKKVLISNVISLPLEKLYIDPLENPGNEKIFKCIRRFSN